MTSDHPSIVVIGGPNGAGKSTISRPVINEVLGLAEFVNADVIAQGLSGFNPERAALQAGRIMLNRLHELAANSQSFAFETTLASRTFAPWLIDLQSQGYRTHIIFVWLTSRSLPFGASNAASVRAATSFQTTLSVVVINAASPTSSTFTVHTPMPGASTITRQPNQDWLQVVSKASSNESRIQRRWPRSKESLMNRQPKKTVTDYFRSGKELDNAVRRAVRTATARPASRSIKARKAKSSKAA